MIASTIQPSEVCKPALCILLWFFMGILFLFTSTNAEIVINEVLYDPPGSDTQAAEWIELYNNGSDQSMENWSMDPDGAAYFNFPNFVFPSGKYLLLSIKAGGGAEDLDFSDNLGHLYIDNTSKLGNSSGHVDLYNSTSHSSSTIVDFVEWGVGGQEHEDWAVAANIWTTNDAVADVVEGHSIEYDGSGNSSSDWFDQANPTGGSDNSLPVELSSFTAKVDGLAVRLEWTTYSEISNHGFSVLRAEREDGVYQDISGLIQGAGTSSDKHEYSYRDERVEVGRSYWYQLKQIDYDGTSKVHGPVKVTITSNESFNGGSLPSECCLLGNYPNPFNAGTKIVLMAGTAESDIEVGIFDMLGRKVSTLVAGNLAPGRKEYLWNGADDQGQSLPTGVYFCTISSAKGGSSSIKLVKMD